MALDCHCGPNHFWDCGYHPRHMEAALKRQKEEEERHARLYPPGWLTDELKRVVRRVHRDEILTEINQERRRQDEKWGEQNHTDLDEVLLNREGGCSPKRMAEEYEIPTEIRAKAMCDIAANRGELTWAHILVEELAEVVGTMGDVEALREELIQCAAVCVAWVEAIDRRKANGE